MNEFESPMTKEQEVDINQRGEEMISLWAKWEDSNWKTRFIEGEDEEEHRGKIEQMHRTSVLALAGARIALSNRIIARMKARESGDLWSEACNLPEDSTTETTKSRISHAFNRSLPFELFMLLGPCSATSDKHIMDSEGSELRDLAGNDLVTAHRGPVWKPRSSMDSWWGEETTNPDEALALVRQRSIESGNFAIEIGVLEHIQKYIENLAFAWVGSRNFENIELQSILAKEHPELPLGIKNNLDGDVDSLFKRTRELQQMRPEGSAPVVPIFRGGSKLQSPEQWRGALVRLWHMTSGKMIVDVAHGGEQAHDPNKLFGKSVQGQIACTKHLIELMLRGVIVRGIMMETSDIKSPTDPNIPFNEGIRLSQELKQAFSDLT